MKIILLTTTIASLILLILATIYFVGYVYAKIKLKQSNKIYVKKNINGNKIAGYFFRKWKLDDVNLVKDDSEQLANSYITAYNIDNKTLFLSVPVFNDKSLTSITIAFYEACRVKLNYQNYKALKMQKVANILFYSIIIVLLVNALKPYKIINLGNVLVWDLLTLGIVFIVIFIWYFISVKEENRVFKIFKEELDVLPLFNKDEVEKLLKIAKNYQRVVLVQQKKLDGGKISEKKVK